jgi:hypothetical protein
VARYAGFDSARAFAEDAWCWHIDETDGHYRIAEQREKDGVWVSDPERTDTLREGIALSELCQRVIRDLELGEYVRLPDGERIDELGDFLEWIANAKPEDAPAIRGEIKRYYYDRGDNQAGDAVSRMLDQILAARLTRKQRQAILDEHEIYTRADPADVIAMMRGTPTPTRFTRLRAWVRYLTESGRR